MSMFKKPLALMTAGLILLASLSGCAGGTTPSSSEGGGSAADGSSSSEVQKPEVDKTAKLRIAVPANAAVQGYGDGTEDDNMFINALREKTGYTNLEINAISQENELDTFNMMFASGDVYDMIQNNNFDLFRHYSAQKALLPIEDLLDQFGAAVKENLTEDAIASVTVDNQLLAIPMPFFQKYDDVALGTGVLVRKDIMESLNLSYPKDTEELYTFLKTIKEANPGGNMGAPYVANAGDSGNPFWGLSMFTAAFALDGLMDMAVPFIVHDGKLVDAQDVYLKDCLTYLNRLYADGLIDNEYLFTTRANATEKLTGGQAAMAEGGYWDVSNFTAAAASIDPNASFGFMPVVKGPDGTSGNYQPQPLNQYFMIPKDAKHSKEAVDFLNTYMNDKELQTFISFGEEGVHYKTENGAMTAIQPAYGEIGYKLHFRMWSSPEIWLPNALMAGYEPAMKDYAETGDKLTRFNINHYRPKADVELDKSRTLIDLRNEYCAKIITGSLPVSAVDEYLAAADANGRQEVIQASQEWYETTGKAIYEKLSK